MDALVAQFVEIAARAGEARDAYDYQKYEIENSKLFALKDAVLSSSECLNCLKEVAFEDSRPWVRLLAAAAIMTVDKDVAASTFLELSADGGMISIDANLHLSILHDMQKQKS